MYVTGFERGERPIRTLIDQDDVIELPIAKHVVMGIWQERPCEIRRQSAG